MTIRKPKNAYIRRSRVSLPEIYSSTSEAFRIVYAEVVLAFWIAVPPGPGNLGSRLVRVDRPLCYHFRRAVWRQYPRPDETVWVLTVPLKGSGYSSSLVCTQYSLTDSHLMYKYHNKLPGRGNSLG